jgi:hypothetical protein
VKWSRPAERVVDRASRIVDFVNAKVALIWDRGVRETPKRTRCSATALSRSVTGDVISLPYRVRLEKKDLVAPIFEAGGT